MKETTHRFTVDLPRDLYRRLKLHCVLAEVNMATVIRQLVESYLEKAEKKTKP